MSSVGAALPPIEGRNTLRRQVEQTLERLPLKYVMAWQYNGLMPRAAIAKSMELFMEKVMGPGF